MVAPVGGGVFAGTAFIDIAGAAAAFARRGGAATRPAGAAAVTAAAAVRALAARVLSGRTRLAGTDSPPGAALSAIGGVGVRCEAGTTGAGRGGGGELGGDLSAGACTGAGAAGAVPDWACATCAAPKTIMDAAIRMRLMVSPSWC
jgi:hypothetical protein